MALYQSQNKSIEYIVVGDAIQIGDGVQPAIDNIYNATLVIPEQIENKFVTVIGKYAFAQCSIGEIVIPDTITTVFEEAFSSLQNSNQIIFPASTTYINHGCFAGATIKFLDLSKCNFKYFQGSYHCIDSKIDRIILPPTLLELPYAFFWNSQIKEFTFPRDFQKYNGGAFIGTSKLATIIIVHNNIVYTRDFKTLVKYPAETEIDILPSVTRILGGAFSGCSIVNFSLKNKIKYIENGMNFRLCPYLKICDLRNIKFNWIPHAFLCECPVLETVIFPFACKFISSYVLSFNPSLKSIYFLGDVYSIDEKFITTSNVHIYYCGKTEIQAKVPLSTIIHVANSFPKNIETLMNISISSRDYECSYLNDKLLFYNPFIFICTVQQTCYQQFSIWALFPIIFM